MWQQKLYAFLLRRILGPYLSPDSNDKLSECLDFSLNEGKFILKDIELDSDFLTHCLIASSSSSSSAKTNNNTDEIERNEPSKNTSIQVKYAKVNHLGIHLSMTSPSSSSNSKEKSERNSSSSSSSTSSQSLSLLARIEIEGVYIGLIPFNEKDCHLVNAQNFLTNSKQTANTYSSNSSSSSSSQGYLSSLVDSALSSLRLTVAAHDLSVRFYNETGNEWVDVTCASFQYSDIPSSSSTTNRNEILNKRIEFGVMSSVLASHNKKLFQKILTTEGIGLVNVRVVNIPHSLALQHDIGMVMNFNTYFSLQLESISSIANITYSFLNCMKKEKISSPPPTTRATAIITTNEMEQQKDHFLSLQEEITLNKESNESTMALKNTINDNELYTLDGLMRQYAEAKHYARTREIRGGILLPSNAFENKELTNDNQDDVSFDAFFDCNSSSFSHYLSILHSSHHLEEHLTTTTSTGADADAEKKESLSLKFHLYLLHCQVKIDCNDEKDSLILDIADVNASSNLNFGDVTTSLGISHFQLKHFSILEDLNQHTSILRFTKDISDLDTSLVTSPACIFITCKKSQEKNDFHSPRNVTYVEIDLQPFEVLLLPTIISPLSTIFSKLKENISYANSSVPQQQNSSILSKNTIISCPRFSIFLSTQIKQAQYENNLFKRRGHTTDLPHSLSYFDNLDQRYTALMLHFEKVAFEQNLLNNSMSNNIALTLYSSTVCFVEYGLNDTPLLIEFLGLESETSLAFDSLIKIQYDESAEKNQEKFNSFFPIVPPLSTVKARQPRTSQKKDNTTNNTEDEYTSQRQQSKMLQDANNCNRSLNVNIPFLLLDITKSEKKAAIALLSEMTSQWVSHHKASTDLVVHDSATDNKGSAEAIGISINFDQAICIINESVEHGTEHQLKNLYSYILILDDFKAHAIIDDSLDELLRQCRILARDITLYEGKISSRSILASNESIIQPKQLAVKLLKDFQSQEANPIFYRNNVCCPLSSDTPSFHVDVVFRGDEDDDSFVDFSINLFLYDIMYRYQYDALWVKRIQSLFQAEDPISKVDAAEATTSFAPDMSYVFAAFLTCSDCIIDYTPPFGVEGFTIPSRLLLRIGEMRTSTNFVSSEEASAFLEQSIKMALTDISIHLCNKRYPYFIENSRLSCSSNILPANARNTVQISQSLMKKINEGISFEEAYSMMGFIPICNLDSVDGSVKIKSATLQTGFEEIFRDQLNTCQSHTAKANITIDAVLGHLTFSACKDSFYYLVQTINEWTLQMTSLSQDELLRLREEASLARSKQIHLNSEINQECMDGVIIKDDEYVPSQRKDQTNPDFVNHKLQEKSSVLDAIEEDMFSILKETGGAEKGAALSPVSHEDPLEKPKNVDSKKNSKKDIKNLKDIPDNELSATELRQKYGVVEMDDLASALAQNLLIKNFYTVDTGLQQDIEHNPIKRKEAFIIDSDHRMSKCPTEDINKESVDEESVDWTTIEWKWSHDQKIEPEAFWYHDREETDVREIKQNNENKSIKVYPQHIPKLQQQQVADLFFTTGTMNAAKYAKTKKNPSVNLRILLKDFSASVQFFDGFDWESSREKAMPLKENDKKTQLMQDLLETKMSSSENTSQDTYSANNFMFRNSKRFFHFCFSGVKVRLDTFLETNEHCLSNIMKVSICDFFISETVRSNSSRQPNKERKMVCEWVNDLKHPRDKNDGVIMIKTVTTRPTCKISSDGKIMNDESLASLEFLPLRMNLDQAALRFIRGFFSYSDKVEDPNRSVIREENELVGVFFREFRVKSCKVKVDYRPVHMDVKSLLEGSYVEVLNFFSLEDMELSLRAVDIKSVCGWGAAICDLSSHWIKDICETQMYKFLADATPFHSISTVGGGVINFALLPVFDRRNALSVYREGSKEFANVIALETLNTSSKLTKYLAEALNKAVSLTSDKNGNLPVRPNEIPNNINETIDHALDSISRGLKTANYTILVLPRKEYKRSGASGAFSSFARGAPIGMLAPIMGVSEALSYTLLGVRNQVRPDVKQEEEAEMMFYYGIN